MKIVNIILSAVITTGLFINVYPNSKANAFTDSIDPVIIEEYVSSQEGHTEIVQAIDMVFSNNSSQAAYLPDKLYIDKPEYELFDSISGTGLELQKDSMFSIMYSEYGIWGMLKYVVKDTNVDVKFYPIPYSADLLSDDFCSIMWIASFSPVSRGFLVTDKNNCFIIHSGTEYFDDETLAQDFEYSNYMLNFPYSLLKSYNKINVHKCTECISDIDTSELNSAKINNEKSYSIVDEYGNYLTYANGRFSLATKNESICQCFYLKERNGKFAIVPVTAKRKIKSSDYKYYLSNAYYGKNVTQILTMTSSVKSMTSKQEQSLKLCKYQATSNQNWRIYEAE